MAKPARRRCPPPPAAACSRLQPPPLTRTVRTEQPMSLSGGVSMVSVSDRFARLKEGELGP